MTIVTCFGMMCDVKINLCRSCFQTNTPLQWRRLHHCISWLCL